MLTLPNAIAPILASFATLFTNSTWQKAQLLLVVSRVNYICRLASISFAGSPPWPGPVAGQRWSGSWGRQTPG